MQHIKTCEGHIDMAGTVGAEEQWRVELAELLARVKDEKRELTAGERSTVVATLGSLPAPDCRRIIAWLDSQSGASSPGTVSAPSALDRKGLRSFPSRPADQKRLPGLSLSGQGDDCP